MVKNKTWLSVLSLSAVVIALLNVQWMLLDVSFAFEPTAAAPHIAVNQIGAAGLGVETSPQQVMPFPFLVLTALQMMVAVVIPAVWTVAWLKRARVRARGKPPLTESLNRRNRQEHIFVASPRQLCASPDAHGP